MRKEYSGLIAVVIPIDSSNQFLTDSNCHSIWESHLDRDNNHVCDAIQDGFTQEQLEQENPYVNPSTQAWSDCEYGDEEF